jgi:hypothetical protein
MDTHVIIFSALLFIEPERFDKDSVEDICD